MTGPYLLCAATAAVATVMAAGAILIRRHRLRQRRRYMWAREQELVGLTVAHLYLEHGEEQVWDEFVTKHTDPRPDPQTGGA